MKSNCSCRYSPYQLRLSVQAPPPLPSPHREEEAPPPPQAYPLEIKQVEDTAGKAVIREASTHPLVVQASLQPQTQPPPQADDLDAGADDNVGADNIV